MEWECFEWIWEKITRVSESNMTEFKMAAIIKLSQNEWVKFFCGNGGNQSLANVSEFERKYQDGWMQDGQIQDGRIKDGCHHQVESEWMSEMFCENGGNQSWQVWVTLKENSKMAEYKMAK